MRASPTRHRVALGLALAGVALSAFTLVIHERIAGGGYTSFCDVNDSISCDAVLGSRFGEMLGIPVPAVSLLVFAAGALFALPGAISGTSGGLADLALLGLAAGSLGTAIVLAVIAIFVLRHLCPLCLSMDVVIVAWVVTVVPLLGRFERPSPTVARALTAGALFVAIAGNYLVFRRTPPPMPRSATEIQAQDPKFYAFYTSLPTQPTAEVEGGARHVKGKADAPVTIVEFSDFECPACGAAFPDLRELAHARPEVRFVFRHFPLDSSCNGAVPHALHPDACLAAFAAECAGQQDRFWEYHDLLFTNQRALDRDSLFRYARQLELSIPTFRTCLDDPATRARIAEDVDAGVKAGIMSTPTLFINGRMVQGALDRTYYDYALIIEKRDHDAHAVRGG